jgi:tyrosyl-tRNA synthetase
MEPVWLDRNLTSPFDFYQYFLRTSDADVGRLLRLFTFLSLEEIEGIEKEHKKVGLYQFISDLIVIEYLFPPLILFVLQAPEKRIAQRRLAEEVTRFVHGNDAVRNAIASTELLYGRCPPRSVSCVVASIAAWGCLVRDCVLSYQYSFLFRSDRLITSCLWLLLIVDM